MPSNSRSVLRVYPSQAVRNDKSCPRFLAAKAQVVEWKSRANPAERRGLDTFATSTVDAALDRVEFHDRTVEMALADLRSSSRSVRWHSHLWRWTGHAVRAYLRACAELTAAGGELLNPVEHQWAVQHPVSPGPDQDVREIRAIGRAYESSDGSVRELRMLRAHSVDPRRRTTRPRDPAELAAIAIVLAEGRTILRPWDVPFLVSSTEPVVRRVRIVEIGLHDGTHDVVFDETAAQALQLYQQHARGALADSVSGEERRPGYDCVRCHLRDECRVLRRSPGLLGVHDPNAPARTWSITTGRRHRKCPCQAHFRDLRLPYPAEAEYSVAARRGKAVHQWIEDQHNRVPRRPCHPADVPLGPSWWHAWSLDGAAARRGEQMIGDHAEECPLARMTESDTISTEHQVVVHDPESNTVVHARIDAVYTEDGIAVVRETKTTGGLDDGDLLRDYPQIALNLVLAARGFFGPCSRVELERLTPLGALVTHFDPADEWLVTEALAVVHELAAPWHADLVMAPAPGEECGSCEVSLWCPENRAEKR